MRDRFSVCETPITHVSATHPTTNRPNQKPSSPYAVASFLCVRPSVRPSASASASTRPRPPLTIRSPEQSVVASSDFESSVNVMVFAHAESIPHAFRGCRDHYICQLEPTLISVCPSVRVRPWWEMGGALPIRTCGRLGYDISYTYMHFVYHFISFGNFM